MTTSPINCRKRFFGGRIGEEIRQERREDDVKVKANSRTAVYYCVANNDARDEATGLSIKIRSDKLHSR